MAKPTNKEELLNTSAKNYRELFTYIDSLGPIEQIREFPPGTLNRNIRDVIAHLHHWHLLFLTWYEVGMTGRKPQMPAKGFSWKETPELNAKIRDKYSSHPLESTREMLSESYICMQKIIQSHSESELFEKKRYRWTGSTSLAAYIIANTSSHYQWALKLIKRSLVNTEKSK